MLDITHKNKHTNCEQQSFPGDKVITGAVYDILNTLN